MPGYEPAVAISVRLGERVAEGYLSAEVHISEE